MRQRATRLNGSVKSVIKANIIDSYSYLNEQPFFSLLTKMKFAESKDMSHERCQTRMPLIVKVDVPDLAGFIF